MPIQTTQVQSDWVFNQFISSLGGLYITVNQRNGMFVTTQFIRGADYYNRGVAVADYDNDGFFSTVRKLSYVLLKGTTIL